MPGLNEIIEASAVHGSGKRRWSKYATLKKRWAKDLDVLVDIQGFEVRGKAFTYMFVEKDRRRDPSNIMGAIKLIEDSLQEAGILENDGWNHIEYIQPYWTVDPHNPGVVLATSDEPLAFEAMMGLWELSWH